MAKISDEIKKQVLEVVKDFNQKQGTHFYFSFKGQYAYLAKTESNEVNTILQAISKKMGVFGKGASPQNSQIETKLGRLQYKGAMDNWSFAVFRYSNEKYDPNEFMFPGSFELDGTIEGALNAGMHLY